MNEKEILRSFLAETFKDKEWAFVPAFKPKDYDDCVVVLETVDCGVEWHMYFAVLEDQGVHVYTSTAPIGFNRIGVVPISDPDCQDKVKKLVEEN